MPTRGRPRNASRSRSKARQDESARGLRAPAASFYCETVSRNRFAATRLTPAQAHEVWGRSDEASAFTRPDYLAQLVDEVEWWGVERSGEAVAAWPLVRVVTGGEIGPPPFCYYVGPMFARSLRVEKYSRFSIAFNATFSTLIEAVTGEHRRFRFALPLGVTDTRVLQWWNFDHPDQSGFRITPRYTARIDLDSLSDDSALRKSFASSRRQDLNRWAKAPPILVDEVPTERVIELYRETLRRSGGELSPGRQLHLTRSINLANSGAGVVLGLAPHCGEEIEAVILVLDGPAVSNSCFYAASDAWRNQGLTAWAVWQGLLRARSLEKRWFDFNGANSPHRARDKHFYGAHAELYFECHFGDAEPARHYH